MRSRTRDVVLCPAIDAHPIPSSPIPCPLTARPARNTSLVIPTAAVKAQCHSTHDTRKDRHDPPFGGPPSSPPESKLASLGRIGEEAALSPNKTEKDLRHEQKQEQQQEEEESTRGLPPMLRLECAIQTYEWGKPGLTSAVAQLKQEGESNFQADDKMRYAELWMGTHPSGPSYVVLGEDDKKVPLKEYLKAHPQALGSEPSAEGDLPFMFKVLSISKALSIQAHPDKRLAEQLHASRPQVYKDGNHKPEMAISLTDFEALCGFRPLEELVAHLVMYPELGALVGMEEQALLEKAAGEGAGEEEQREALKAVFSSYMHASEERTTEQVAALAARLKTKEEKGGADDLDRLILRLLAHFPGDCGVFGPLFLNYVRLGSGKAFVMQANEPHAYLSGDILECMACSDNVVRVGLTPKYRDVRTLLGMLSYTSGPMAVTEGEVLKEGGGEEHRRFSPGESIPEFEVETIKLEGGGEQERAGGGRVVYVGKVGWALVVVGVGGGGGGGGVYRGSEEGGRG